MDVSKYLKELKKLIKKVDFFNYLKIIFLTVSIVLSKNNLFFIQNLGALAEFFGVERPSLSRVLSDLVKDEKLERIGRNKYKILDKDFFEI